ncbi:MAG TPA: Fe-S oxidoreductase [Rhizobiales bacterium]|nr:Fe-S oxidoreductase [Hyphomicrobiales bacterium]
MDQLEFDFDVPEIDHPARKGKQVGLFVTCLVDLLRPVVGFSSVKLLEDAGFDVVVPQNQTCCGQSAHHSDDKSDAQDLARDVIKTFEPYDYIVTPSKSCAAILQDIYPDLLADDPAWQQRALQTAKKSFELITFLHDVAATERFSSRFQGSITYHTPCEEQDVPSTDKLAKTLLGKLSLIELREMNEQTNAAAGPSSSHLTGTFKKEAHSDTQIPKRIIAAGAGTVLSNDMGHLMNLARLLKRDGSAIEVRHVAEVLADMADGPAIGEKQFANRKT